MVVIAAERVPDKVRGVLKLWFIEPKPNFFVSAIKGSVAEKVVELVAPYLTSLSGVYIIKESTVSFSGLEIRSLGSTDREIDRRHGFPLIKIPTR